MSVTLDREPDRPHVAHLRIDLGELNLLTAERARQIRRAVTDVPEGVSVLTVGAAGDPGRGLTAGLDLEWARDLPAHEGQDLLVSFYRTIQSFRDLDAVTVCRCGEYALGVGFELAAACEFRVATAGADLGLPEVDVGLPTVIHGGLLVRLVGQALAEELVYTGRTLSGREAADRGLVTRAPDAGAYDAAVGDLVDDLAAKSPLTLRLQKRTMRRLRSNGLESGMRASVAEAGRAFGSHDQQEAMAAFLEGRQPEFEGR